MDPIFSLTGTNFPNDDGDLRYIGAEGVGNLTVSSGTFELSSLLSVSLLSVGAGTGGEGTFRVTGPDTNLSLTENSLLFGAIVGVGQEFGEGRLIVENGATLNLDDPGGNAGANIGAFNGGIGSLLVDASTLVISSDRSFINMGLAGSIFSGTSGTGNIPFENGAVIDVLGDTISGSVLSNGSLLVDDSTVTFDADQTFLNVGRNGISNAVITNGSTVTLEGVVSGSFISVGRDVNFISRGDASTGTLTVEDRSELILNADAGALDGGQAHVRVGRTGGQGVLNVDEATLRATSQTDFSGLSIGVQNFDGSGITGGDGEVNIINGGTVEFRAENDRAFVSVGADAENTGRLNIEGGSNPTQRSELIVSSPNDIAQINIGSDGSTGVLTASSENPTITVNGVIAEVNVGHVASDGQGGGSGVLELSGRAVLTLEGESARFAVGASDNTTGEVTLRSGVRVDASQATESSFLIGVGENVGASSVTIGTGATVEGFQETSLATMQQRQTPETVRCCLDR